MLNLNSMSRHPFFCPLETAFLLTLRRIPSSQFNVQSVSLGDI